MSDNTYSQAKTQVTTDSQGEAQSNAYIKAKANVTTKVVDYLKSPEGRANFTAEHLEKAIRAVENPNSINNGSRLNDIVKDFVDTLGPKSIRALDEAKINELSKSIGRCIISQVKPATQANLTYNEEQHEGAYWNFRKVDQSKYDHDGVPLGKAISDALKDNADTLQANKKLNQNMVKVTLSTQLPSEDEIQGKKEIIVALATGMIAKVGGRDTPFKNL